MTFGRYTDSFKSKEKLDFWNESEKLFTNKQYFDSYVTFFKYLGDDEMDNLSFTRQDDSINFQFFQGSKLITGSINDNKITAESHIADYEKLAVAFMRRLMENNYSLYYTRFAFKDNSIYLKFNSSVLDGSPRKLYYALRELATRSDKQDDTLVNDFPVLKKADVHIIELPDAEKEIKYKYFQKWIGDAIKRVSELNDETFSGAISYLLLDIIYKIDYLIMPQGMTTNDLEKIHYAYFARDNRPFPAKNKDMRDAFQKLLDKPKEKVMADIYGVKSTFGVANPAPHQAVIDVFNNNLGNVKWYIENKHDDLAVNIYEYIAGFCLFSYGLPKPDIRLFDLLLNITVQDYYNEMGLPEKYYDWGAKKFDESGINLIKNKIDGIIKEGTELFPDLKFDTTKLKFDSLLNFLRSYLAEIQNLNFNA